MSGGLTAVKPNRFILTARYIPWRQSVFGASALLPPFGGYFGYGFIGWRIVLELRARVAAEFPTLVHLIFTRDSRNCYSAS